MVVFIYFYNYVIFTGIKKAFNENKRYFENKSKYYLRITKIIKLLLIVFVLKCQSI